MPAVQKGHLPVGQLQMYYEVHGAGEPLVWTRHEGQPHPEQR